MYSTPDVSVDIAERGKTCELCERSGLGHLIFTVERRFRSEGNSREVKMYICANCLDPIIACYTEEAKDAGHEIVRETPHKGKRVPSGKSVFIVGMYIDDEFDHVVNVFSNANAAEKFRASLDTGDEPDDVSFHITEETVFDE